MSKLLDSIGGVLKQVAPGIATMLGGPLAGVAVKALGDTFLPGDSAPTEQQLIAAVGAASPEQLVRLREVDAELTEKFVNAGIELEKLSNDDRSSARNMMVQTGDSWTPRILAFSIVVLYAVVQFTLMSADPLAQEMRELVMRGLGTLDASLGIVLAFYFGSSATSRLKDEIVSRLSKR